MSTTLNGNGHGANPLLQLLKKTPAKPLDDGAASDIKESRITFATTDGMRLQGAPIRVTRFAAVFELYNPDITPRLSESLDEFKIILQSRVAYSGRATVRNAVEAGAKIVCEVTLDENLWTGLNFTDNMLGSGKLRGEFTGFMQEWQKLYKITPEYKIIVADMQSYLTDLRFWLEQVDLGMRSSAPNDPTQFEQDVVTELAESILPCLDHLFETFESNAKKLEADLLPAHQNYMRRQLHPLVLSAPFAQRTFHKPLGYAGDYEMVNMIVRNKHEGGSLFAKIVNTWFLSQPPSEAHRNRIGYLTDLLCRESMRVVATGQAPHILDVACGPAQEIQKFLIEHPISGRAKFTLLDFNKETLEYLRATLDGIIARHPRDASFKFVKKSVFQIIKESNRKAGGQSHYDVIFCAGLFDYLSDKVCRELMNIMYDWLAPGGLLVVTNVESSNPLRHGMGHLLDWHLIYRNSRQLHQLTPAKADPGASIVRADDTGVNIFLEVRKSSNG